MLIAVWCFFYEANTTCLKFAVGELFHFYIALLDYGSILTDLQLVWHICLTTNSCKPFFPISEVEIDEDHSPPSSPPPPPPQEPLPERHMGNNIQLSTCLAFFVMIMMTLSADGKSLCMAARAYNWPWPVVYFPLFPPLLAAAMTHVVAHLYYPRHHGLKFVDVDVVVACLVLARGNKNNSCPIVALLFLQPAMRYIFIAFLPLLLSMTYSIIAVVEYKCAQYSHALLPCNIWRSRNNKVCIIRMLQFSVYATHPLAPDH